MKHLIWYTRICINRHTLSLLLLYQTHQIVKGWGCHSNKHRQCRQPPMKCMMIRSIWQNQLLPLMKWDTRGFIDVSALCTHTARTRKLNDERGFGGGGGCNSDWYEFKKTTTTSSRWIHDPSKNHESLQWKIQWELAIQFFYSTRSSSSSSSSTSNDENMMKSCRHFTLKRRKKKGFTAHILVWASTYVRRARWEGGNRKKLFISHSLCSHNSFIVAVESDIVRRRCRRTQESGKTYIS